MKKISLLLLSIFLSQALLAQPINVEYDTDNNPYLWGAIDKTGMQGPNYASWFDKNFEGYNPNNNTIALIAKRLSDITILAFMGTWCGDSKREVPRFYKVLEAANYPMGQLQMIAVRSDREYYKQGPNNEQEGYNIHRVPTFILFKEGKEIGRIVESPKTSIEADLLQILNGNYTPKYPIVSYVDALLKKSGIKSIEGRKAKKILKTWQDSVATKYHLNTYAIVLNSAQKMQEAIAVMALNTAFFPKEASTYENLAQLQEKAGILKDALANFKTAIQLNPESEKAKSGIARLSE